MPVLLEGGCRVVPLREGSPERRDGTSLWHHFGTHAGATALTLRILELDPGARLALGGADRDEVLYVLEGAGRAHLADAPVAIEAGHGLFLGAGRALELESTGEVPLVLASSQCPAQPGHAPPPMARRLFDRPAETTADRWYRVLFDEQAGSHVTQFVGSIPPGRAPDHYHEYEEALVILMGTGRMWAGRTNAPIGPGSCVFLPRRQVHCVENAGAGELRLLGVFFPAGSPAVRYEAH